MNPGSLLGIVGAGHYGTRLAIMSSLLGKYNVKLIDVGEEQLSKSNIMMEHLLMKLQTREVIDQQEFYDIPQRISVSNKLEAISEADFVVECVDEDYNMKMNLMRDLDNILHTNTTVASSTIRLSISKIALETKNPARILGMQLSFILDTEKDAIITPSLFSSRESLTTANFLTKSLKQTPKFAKDNLGFSRENLLYAYINENLNLLSKDLSNSKNLDAESKNQMKVPFGPIELADLIGLDVVVKKLDKFYLDTKDNRFKPNEILLGLVDSQSLGRKSGKGFYDYANE